MLSILAYLILALAAGACLPTQAGINAHLNLWTRSPVLAAAISFAVGTMALILAFAYLVERAVRYLVLRRSAADVAQSRDSLSQTLRFLSWRLFHEIVGLIVFLYAGDAVRRRLAGDVDESAPAPDSAMRRIADRYGARGLGLIGPIFPGVTASGLIAGEALMGLGEEHVNDALVKKERMLPRML